MPDENSPQALEAVVHERQGSEAQTVDAIDAHFAESRPMTEWEAKVTADFFWSQFEEGPQNKN